VLGVMFIVVQRRKSRVFRAVRTAEQNPGDSQSMVKHTLREVIAMVKQLHHKAGPFAGPTLVILGWLALFSSFFVTSPFWAILLQSVARVLP